MNCVVFAKGRSSLRQLVTTPMTCFTRAKQTIQGHYVQTTHRVAMEDSAAYIGQMETDIRLLSSSCKFKLSMSFRETEPF